MFESKADVQFLILSVAITLRIIFLVGTCVPAIVAPAPVMIDKVEATATRVQGALGPALVESSRAAGGIVPLAAGADVDITITTSTVQICAFRVKGFQH